MKQQTAGQRQGRLEDTPGRAIPTERRILLCSLGLLIVGTAGYFALRGHWSFYLLAHLGALGVICLFGATSGLIAKKKGYDFVKAFLLGSLVPIVLGIVAVLAIRYLGEEGTPFYCGGSVSLAVAILIIIGYLLFRRKPVKPL